MRDFIVAPEAQADIDEAFNWYEDCDEGLGVDFLDHLEECFERIRSTPKAFPRVYKDRRRALVSRFPYSVFFESSDESIVVLCVFHSSRNPTRWRRRLK